VRQISIRNLEANTQPEEKVISHHDEKKKNKKKKISDNTLIKTISGLKYIFTSLKIKWQSKIGTNP
jgi:hypothetical protein